MPDDAPRQPDNNLVRYRLDELAQHMKDIEKDIDRVLTAIAQIQMDMAIKYVTIPMLEERMGKVEDKLKAKADVAPFQWSWQLVLGVAVLVSIVGNLYSILFR